MCPIWSTEISKITQHGSIRISKHYQTTVRIDMMPLATFKGWKTGVYLIRWDEIRKTTEAVPILGTESASWNLISSCQGFFRRIKQWCQSLHLFAFPGKSIGEFTWSMLVYPKVWVYQYDIRPFKTPRRILIAATVRIHHFHPFPRSKMHKPSNIQKEEWIIIVANQPIYI